MDSRRRPFHTCGVSAFAIAAHKPYIKAQDLKEPFRSMAKTIAILGSLVSSRVCPATFLVNYLFFMLTTVAFSYHQDMFSTRPGHLLAEVFNIYFNSMGFRQHKGNRDCCCTSYNESNGVSAAATDHETKLPKESPSHVGFNNKETFPPVSEKPKTEAEKVGEIAIPSSEKGTYKEVLERGKREKLEKKEAKNDAKKDENPEDIDIVKIEAEDESSTSDGVALKNDSILSNLILDGL
ncbi:hypothetical protein REPUB_Repub04eG0199900 [Reevesia pubescens]